MTPPFHDASASAQTLTQPGVLRRMANIREAFRLTKIAHAHRALWTFYLEHNLITHAGKARMTMFEHLHCAKLQWRTALGMAR